MTITRIEDYINVNVTEEESQSFGNTLLLNTEDFELLEIFAGLREVCSKKSQVITSSY